jgi:hypothetical protein
LVYSKEMTQKFEHYPGASLAIQSCAQPQAG